MRLRRYWKLIRPWNGVLVFCCVYGGFHLGGAAEPADYFSVSLISLAFLTFVVTSAANMINDYFDLSVDRINRPERPLPAGEIEPTRVFHISTFLFFATIFQASFYSLWIRLIVLIAVIISFFYTPILKKMGLIKNLSIALNVFFAFMCGGLLSERVTNAVPIAFFSSLLIIYREIIKDIYDYEGDKENGVYTLTVKWGVEKSWRFAFICLNVLTISVFLSHFIYPKGLVFYAFIIVFVLVPLLLTSFLIKRKKFDKAFTKKTLSLSKVLMFIGLFIFILF